jgi:SAM-dependent methyltransferase
LEEILLPLPVTMPNGEAQHRARAMKTLDFGCGQQKTPGSIGVDVRPLPGVDVVCDLERFPYPFATDSIAVIYMNHVLEHLDNPVRVLTELWRVCEHGAKVHIRVPHCTGPLAWRDPTHKRSFTSESFNYFGQNSFSFYTPARFNVETLRLVYFVYPPERKVIRLFGAVVQKLLASHPTFTERFLAYLAGGIDEIQVTLVAVKPSGSTVAK